MYLSDMLRATILLLFLGLIISCNESNQSAFICKDTSLGRAISIDSIELSLLLPNIMTPDLDSAYNLLGVYDYRDTTQLNPFYSIDSISVHVYDNSQTLYTSDELVDYNQGWRRDFLYLWDGYHQGLPYYGDLRLDVLLRFNNEYEIEVTGHEFLSVSCEQIKYCYNNGNECGAEFCRDPENLIPYQESCFSCPTFWTSCD